MSSKKEKANEQETAVNSLASMTKVMLYISCENLRTKSDTVAQVILDDRLAGSTEVCRLTDFPVYKTPITVQYFFEKRQKLRVDIVHGQVAYRREIPIGRFESELAAVILGPGSKLTGSLGKDSGKILIRAVEVAKKGGVFRDDQFDLTISSGLSLSQSGAPGNAGGPGNASDSDVESLAGDNFAITEEFGELDEVRYFIIIIYYNY